MPRGNPHPKPRQKQAAPTPAPAAPAPARPPRYVWGIEAIGAEVDVAANVMDHMIRSGAVKTPRKVGGKWCADREKLHAEMRGEVQR
jgi:hypothetical protein